MAYANDQSDVTAWLDEQRRRDDKSIKLIALPKSATVADLPHLETFQDSQPGAGASVKDLQVDEATINGLQSDEAPIYRPTIDSPPHLVDPPDSQPGNLGECERCGMTVPLGARLCDVCAGID